MAETWKSECATVSEQKDKNLTYDNIKFYIQMRPEPETYFCLHKTNTFCFTEGFIHYSTFS